MVDVTKDVDYPQVCALLMPCFPLVGKGTRYRKGRGEEILLPRTWGKNDMKKASWMKASSSE